MGCGRTALRSTEGRERRTGCPSTAPRTVLHEQLARLHRRGGEGALQQLGVALRFGALVRQRRNRVQLLQERHGASDALHTTLLRAQFEL